MVPSGKTPPDAGSQLTDGAESTRSVDVATKVWTAPSGPVASIIADGGTSSVGGVVSTTVTSKLPPVLFSDASAAVHATVVVPSGNKLPDAGSQLTEGAGSTGSVDVATKVCTAPSGPVASSVADGGSPRVGGAVSATGVAVGVGGMAVGSGVAVGVGGPTVGSGVAVGFGGPAVGLGVAVGVAVGERGVAVGSGVSSTAAAVAVDVGVSVGRGVDVAEGMDASSKLVVSGDEVLVGVGTDSAVAVGVGVGSNTTVAVGVTIPAESFVAALVGLGAGVDVAVTGACRWRANRLSGVGVGEGVPDGVGEGSVAAAVGA